MLNNEELATPDQQEAEPQQINQPPYPGTTRIEGGQAFDISGKPLGAVDETGKPVAAPAPITATHRYDPDTKSIVPVAAPAAKPKFDPNATYESVTRGGQPVAAAGAPKPKFDPNAAYESVTRGGQPVAAPVSAPPSVQASGVLPAATIGPRESSFHNWLQDVQGDVRNGTATTWVGSILKRFGAKGTSYGVSEPVGEFMAGPTLGVPKALEGVLELKEAEPIFRDIASGMNPATAVALHVKDARRAEIAVNKIVGGGFQTLGPAALVTAPEALPVVVSAMAAQSQAQKAAIYMGADEDTAEMVGNVAAIAAGTGIHKTLHPITERFGVAVNNRTAAEQEYISRSRELETARGQAAEMQQRAIEAAQRETIGQGNPAETDAARTMASEATKNVANAQKAFDQASARRADATIEVDKLHRKITSAADKVKAEEYERTTTESKKATDLIKKAVPSRGANQYSDEDLDRVLAHTEAAKAKGIKINDLPDLYQVTEGGRQGIEDQLKPALEKYEQEPLTEKAEDSPKMRVSQKLEEMAKVDGNFSNAIDHLSNFNITDPTVGEAQNILTKLNSYNRAAMKGANNWDIYNMIETNPAFAARYFMAEELRSALYDRLEGHGIQGAAEARSEEASLIRFRDAVGAQIRANRGGTRVRGSGTQNRLRQLVANLAGKTGRAAGAGIGAEMAGVPGAIAGAALGETAVEPIERAIASRDMTRDEHVEKAMKYRGTMRKPARITGEGTPPVIPTEAIPPALKDLGPASIKLTPRENTELHAELAAHYGESNLEDISYQELEQRLRDDAETKKRNGIALDPAEKTLLTKILKADTADRAVREAASSSISTVEIAPKGKTPEEIAAEKKEAAKRSNLMGIAAVGSHVAEANQPPMEAEERRLPKGHTNESFQNHEHGHNYVATRLGIESSDIVSHEHEDIAGTNAAGGIGWKDRPFALDPKIAATKTPEEIWQNTKDWLAVYMGGAAANEALDGMSLEDNTGLKGDVRQAREILKAHGIEGKDANILITDAYERAKKLLTEPGALDIIRENAKVREENLPTTLHASAGRMENIREQIRRNNERNQNAAANARAREGGGAIEEGQPEAARGGAPVGVEGRPEARSEVRVPPERTTGKSEVDEAIKTGGGIPGGIQRGFEYKDRATGETKQFPDMALFHDPTSGSTLALPSDQVTPELVKQQLTESRAKYAAAEAKNRAKLEKRNNLTNF